VSDHSTIHINSASHSLSESDVNHLVCTDHCFLLYCLLSRSVFTRHSCTGRYCWGAY